MAAETQRSMPWWKILLTYSIFESGDSAWSLIIVSTYMAKFLQATLGQTATTFGGATTVGALLIALISPVLGASADASGRRQPYLRFFVFGVVICTALIGFSTSVPMALAFFVIAYMCVNGAFTFFTAMLPAVSTKENVSWVLPMTVGIGYAGGLICLPAMGLLVKEDVQAGRVFLPMALIYLALAFPAMFLSRDLPAKSGHKIDIAAAYRRIGETFRQAKQHRHLFRFLIGDFFYENSVASVITLMSVYAGNIMGFKANELTLVFGPAIVVAMISAWVVFGPLVRKIGPKKAVLVDLGIWMLLFVMALLIRPGTTVTLGSTVIGTKTLFSVAVAPLAGMGLAGVWSTSRVLMTALTPVEKSGEFWGLYNLSGRTATVLGDATWTAILYLLGESLFGYQMAILALAAYVLIGFVIVVTLPDARPSAANFLEA